MTDCVVMGFSDEMRVLTEIDGMSGAEEEVEVGGEKQESAG